MRRVYRYRLHPTGGQARALETHLAAGCQLYNAALEQRHRAYREHGKSVSFGEQSAELRELRALGLVPADGNFWSQQAVLRQLDRAFAAFFRRAKQGERPGYPRFKSDRRFSTLTWTFKGNAGGVSLTDQGRLRLQGVGCVKVKWHRSIPHGADLGEVKVTRSSDGKRWHACFCVELPDPAACEETGEMVGIDLGVRKLVSLSTGEQIGGPRAGRAGSAKTRRAARKVARRQRGSNRRCKAVLLLARQREREANQRRDHGHKLSRQLVDRFDLIAHENLNVRNMLRSARGTVEQPGINVAQKRGLNREISDQGWSQFLSFLAYKAEEAGRQVIAVPPPNTSRTCAECTHVDARSRNGSRFRCTACSHTADADVNAAQVILARALAQTKLRPGWGRQAKTAALAAVA